MSSSSSSNQEYDDPNHSEYDDPNHSEYNDSSYRRRKPIDNRLGSYNPHNGNDVNQDRNSNPDSNTPSSVSGDSAYNPSDDNESSYGNPLTGPQSLDTRKLSPQESSLLRERIASLLGYNSFMSQEIEGITSSLLLIKQPQIRKAAAEEFLYRLFPRLNISETNDANIINALEFRSFLFKLLEGPPKPKKDLDPDLKVGQEALSPNNDEEERDSDAPPPYTPNDENRNANQAFEDPATDEAFQNYLETLRNTRLVTLGGVLTDKAQADELAKDIQNTLSQELSGKALKEASNELYRTYRKKEILGNPFYVEAYNQRLGKLLKESFAQPTPTAEKISAKSYDLFKMYAQEKPAAISRNLSMQGLSLAEQLNSSLYHQTTKALYAEIHTLEKQTKNQANAISRKVNDATEIIRKSNIKEKKAKPANEEDSLSFSTEEYLKAYRACSDATHQYEEAEKKLEQAKARLEATKDHDIDRDARNMFQKQVHKLNQATEKLRNDLETQTTELQAQKEELLKKVEDKTQAELFQEQLTAKESEVDILTKEHFHSTTKLELLKKQNQHNAEIIDRALNTDRILQGNNTPKRDAKPLHKWVIPGINSAMTPLELARADARISQTKEIASHVLDKKKEEKDLSPYELLVKKLINEPENTLLKRQLELLKDFDISIEARQQPDFDAHSYMGFAVVASQLEHKIASKNIEDLKANVENSEESKSIRQSNLELKQALDKIAEVEIQKKIYQDGIDENGNPVPDKKRNEVIRKLNDAETYPRPRQCPTDASTEEQNTHARLRIRDVVTGFFTTQNNPGNLNNLSTKEQGDLAQRQLKIISTLSIISSIASGGGATISAAASLNALSVTTGIILTTPLLLIPVMPVIMLVVALVISKIIGAANLAQDDQNLVERAMGKIELTPKKAQELLKQLDEIMSKAAKPDKLLDLLNTTVKELEHQKEVEKNVRDRIKKQQPKPEKEGTMDIKKSQRKPEEEGTMDIKKSQRKPEEEEEGTMLLRKTTKPSEEPNSTNSNDPGSISSTAQQPNSQQQPNPQQPTPQQSTPQQPSPQQPSPQQPSPQQPSPQSAQVSAQQPQPIPPAQATTLNPNDPGNITTLNINPTMQKKISDCLQEYIMPQTPNTQTTPLTLQGLRSIINILPTNAQNPLITKLQSTTPNIKEILNDTISNLDTTTKAQVTQKITSLINDKVNAQPPHNRNQPLNPTHCRDGVREVSKSSPPRVPTTA